MKPAPVVGLVGSWAWAGTRPEPTARLEARHQALLDEPPPRLPWQRANLSGLLAGLVVLPFCLGQALQPPRGEAPGLRERVVVHLSLLVLWFGVWALANATFITPLGDWADERAEAARIRRAGLTGREQLERVVQLSRAQPLNAIGLEAAGQRLLTLAERHPRIPAPLWEDAWTRTLAGGLADWDHLALELLGPPLEAFLARPGAPLGPADGLRILQRVAGPAHLPPGGDLPALQALDRLLQFQRQIHRITQLRPDDLALQALGRQRWAEVRMAFAQDLPAPPVADLRPGRPPAAASTRRRVGFSRVTSSRPAAGPTGH